MFYEWSTLEPMLHFCLFKIKTVSLVMSSPINNKNNEVIVGARAAFRPPIKNSKFAMSSP